MLTVYSVFDCMTMTDQLGILFSALIWDLCLGELERALHQFVGLVENDLCPHRKCGYNVRTHWQEEHVNVDEADKVQKANQAKSNK